MDTTSQPVKTTTATTASTITLARTTVSTVTSISRSSRTAGRPTADAQRESCWCGQDMDVVRGNHCPRCGTMRARRVPAPLPTLTRLAA